MGFAVYVNVYGNDNDEWKTEEKKDKTLLNLVFKSWFMQASLNYV